MKKEHIIYCISNANTDIYENKLTSFTNLLPKTLELGEKRNWVIGVSAFGLDLNFKEKYRPNIINIKSDITDYNKLGGLTTLYTASIRSADIGEHFYQDVKNIKYFPLLTTSFQSIQIEITDGNNKRLPLKAGQPTFIQLRLHRLKNTMPYISSHIQIDSEMDSHINKSQSNNNFEVHLKTPIYLNSGAKIALTDITFPNSICELPSFIFNEKIEVISQPYEQIFEYGSYVQESVVYDWKEPNASYHMGDMFLVQILNSIRDRLFSRLIEFNMIKMTNTQEKNRHVLSARIINGMADTNLFKLFEVKIFFPEMLKDIYGIEDDIISITSDTPFVSSKPIKFTQDIKAVPPSLNFKISITSIRGFISLEKKVYTSSSDLLASLNNNLNHQIAEFLKISSQDNRLKIERAGFFPELDLTLKASNSMKLLLGVPMNDEITLSAERPKYIGADEVNLNALHPGMMVCYTNFVKHSMIASESFPIFRMIPIRKRHKEDNYITFNFDNLEFHKCNTTRLDLLHFQFKRLDGEFIEFKDNKKIILNLEIRNPK